MKFLKSVVSVIVFSCIVGCVVGNNDSIHVDPEKVGNNVAWSNIIASVVIVVVAVCDIFKRGKKTGSPKKA